MSEELSYINENGDNVFTSQYFLNRGTCCRANCLHCPFGTTIKNLGLQFEQVKNETLDQAKEILLDSQQGQAGIGGDLLANAFGTQKKYVVNANNLKDYYLVLLKNNVCGLFKLEHGKAKKLFLKKHFNNQGLKLEIVQSFFNET